MINSKLNQMIRWQKVHLVIAVYGLLASISAFNAAVMFLRIPSDPEKNVFLGLSIQRLVLMGGMLFVGILMAFVALRAYRHQAWAERIWGSVFRRESLSKGIRLGALIGVLSGWIISFTPAYRFGDFQEYIIRLSPYTTFLLIISIMTFIVTWVEKYGLHVASFLDTLHTQKKTLLGAGFAILIFFLTWLFIVTTGMGVSATDGFWYVTGVPILGLQIMLAFAIGIGIFFLERSVLSNYLPSRLDLFIFLILWGVTAFLWVREPLPPSFFAPGPYLPSFEYYPFSDAATFDLGSQYALIGQGINNSVFFDRALYMAFLVYLHAFAGQDYSLVAAIQAAIYAIFPAILYLLGKSIYSRPFGIILAGLVVLRGINGIAASNMIDLANQKQMLTDFPTVIFVACFSLLTVQWLKAPHKNYLYMLWAGGIIGLAIMLRTNTLFLALFAVFLIVMVYWRQKLHGAAVGFLLLLAMFASTFAWGTYHDKSVFDVYMYRIRLVIEARYPQPAPPVPDLEGGESSSFILAHQNQQVASLYSNFGAFPPLSSSPQPLIVLGNDDAQERPVFYFVVTHFLHNIIMSVFILPTTPVFHDVWHTLKEAVPFWQFYWDGRFSTESGFFLVLNLFLIALGLGVSWRFSKISGLVPLGVFVFYNLANAFARTSGGRYVVPIDWVILFYFALGLFQIVLWGMKLFGVSDNPGRGELVVIEDEPASAVWSWSPIKKAPWVILCFLFLGSLVPLSDGLFSKRYFAQSQAEQFEILEQGGYLQEMGFDKTELAAFSEQWPDFRVISGRALYPRFFLENKGLPKKTYPYAILGFPRIAFTVIGPEGTNYVLLPEADVPFFPNASDVIVLGCQDGSKLDALAVVVIEERTVVYTRQPVSPLQCPLREPVCDNNHVCR